MPIIRPTVELRCFGSDNDGEYKSDKFVEFRAYRGIVQKFMIPYTSELNGVAERMNQI